MEKRIDETRAVARLPTLDIEIAHRRLPDESAEHLSITLRATPDFRAVAQFLDMGAPFFLPAMMMSSPWAQWLRMAWAPWLAAAGMLTDASDAADRRLPPPAGKGRL
jgi:hypothetical protein